MNKVEVDRITEMFLYLEKNRWLFAHTCVSQNCGFLAVNDNIVDAHRRRSATFCRSR